LTKPIQIDLIIGHEIDFSIKIVGFVAKKEANEKGVLYGRG
jgi:hypothetical protein